MLELLLFFFLYNIYFIPNRHDLTFPIRIFIFIHDILRFKNLQPFFLQKEKRQKKKKIAHCSMENSFVGVARKF